MTYHLKIAQYLIVALIGLALPTPQAFAQSTVDILVLYENDVLNTRNGRDISARIASYIDYSNQSYRNSGIDITLRVVGIEELNSGLTSVTSNNLDSLRNSNQIANLRRQTGADVVTLLNLRDQVRGGFVCGIGYLASGSTTRQAFSRGSGSFAYNLVGVDCGLSTFPHEVGHNMGLGHSQRQGSNGGVFSWARGYGVDGLFSTIMAYPQSFGTGNQLPIFSTPARRECEQLPCGIDRNQRDGADAATSLNILADQIASFMPTEIPVDNGNQTNTGSGSVNLPPCQSSAVAGNILQGYDFNSDHPWVAAFGQATLSSNSLETASCQQNYLRITNRSEYFHGARQGFNAIQQNGTYRFSADVAIANSQRQTIHIALGRTINGAADYLYVGSQSATENQFSQLNANVIIEDGGWDRVIVYGPPGGVDILLDNPAFTLVSGQSPVPTPTAVLVNNFENGANGWQSFYGGNLSLSSDSAEGQFSLLSSNRTSRYSGPFIDVSSAIQPFTNYQISVQGKLESNTVNSDQFHLWLYYEDRQGGHWQNVIQESQTIGVWRDFNTTFSISTTGNIILTRLHFLGAQAGTDISVDQLRIE